ncbi:uroporphyrinogen-III C-methyltransferase [Thermodesulfobacteriota bacterium]
MTTDTTERKETKKLGKVYLIGAGPGDPELITVKGQKLLGKAEVVIYDYLASKKLLKHVPKDAEFIYAGKKGGQKHTHTQDEINEMLVERTRSGKAVVRLKGGDPFIFGRGGEEIEELVAAGLPFEVVPGVTSATAAATYAGIPITHRKYTSSVAFITGHEDPTKRDTNIAWDKISTGIGTLVFYMGIKNLPSITEKLIHYGRDPKTKVAVVRWASTPEQKTVVGTLETIAEIVREENIKPPALVVVGEVVALREIINWHENKALFGKRIMVTRTREQASELVSLLEEHGADCLERATISIAPPDSWEDLDRELDQLDQYNWLLFTSINAIKCFFARLFEKGMDTRALKGIQIGVVGRTTAETLLSYGINVDLIPKEFTGDGLADALIAQGVQKERILLPRAAKAREVLPDKLREAGAEVRIVPVYRNARPSGQEAALRQELETREVDLITFTSSSTVNHFIEMLNPVSQDELRELLSGVRLASIGPITSRTIKDKGLEVHIQPEQYTIPDLVNSIVDFFVEQE